MPYLGGALSAIVTIICTWIVENKAGEPLSIAFTISVYSDMTLKSNSRATFTVPISGSMLNTLPTLPERKYKTKRFFFLPYLVIPCDVSFHVPQSNMASYSNKKGRY
jgi:hypothetical protein